MQLRIYTLLVIILLGLLPSSDVYAKSTSAKSATAEKIKAVYIYNFTRFVNWPEITFSESIPLNICVVGDDSVAKELAPIHNNTKGGFQIKVVNLSIKQPARDCHILYVGESVESQSDEILKSISGLPILTLSSKSDFIIDGGIIGFIQRGNTIRLEINRQVARGVQLSINAKLLEVATRIIDRGAES